MAAAEAQAADDKKAGSALESLDAPPALNAAVIRPAGDRLDLAAPEEIDGRGAPIGAPAGALAEAFPVGAEARASADPSLLSAGKPGRQKAKPRAARRPGPQRVIQQGLPFSDGMDDDQAAPRLAKPGRLEQAGQEALPSQVLRAKAVADEVVAVAAPADPVERLEGPRAMPNVAEAAARDGVAAPVAPVSGKGGSPDEAARSARWPDADPLAARLARSEPRDEPAALHPAGVAAPPPLRREVPPAWPVLPDAALSSPARAAALAARLAALDPQDLRQAFRRRQFARKIPASFRPVMAELVARQRALQTPLAEIAKGQRAMNTALDRAAERVGQAWAAELHAALQAARQPQILLPAAPLDPKAQPRPILAREIEAHLARLPEVSEARREVRALLEATYRDPDQAAAQLQALRREHQSAAAAAQQLERQGAALLGRLAGAAWRLSQEERAKRRQAEANGGRIGEAFRALDRIETQQRVKYSEQVRAAEAERRRRLAVAVPGLSRRAEAVVAALRRAGLRPDWRQPRGQPAEADWRLAANIAPLWARVLAEPALKAELERFVQAAAERLSWPKVLEIAAAVAARPDAKAELAAEEKAAVLAHGIAAARTLHRLHPEYQRLAEIECCRSVMAKYPFGQDAPRPVLALWQQDIRDYVSRERPRPAVDPVRQDIILLWERARAVPGALGRLDAFMKAAEAALPAGRVREVVLARQPDGTRPGVDADVALVADAVSVIRGAAAVAQANPDLAARARQVIEQERLAAREAARLQEIERCRRVIAEYPFGEDAPAVLQALLAPQVFGYAWRQGSPAQDPAQQDIILLWERVLADADALARINSFRGKVLSVLPKARIREIARDLRPDGSHPSADADIARLAYAASAIEAARELHRANPEQAALARDRLAAEKVPEVQKLAAPAPGVAPVRRRAKTTLTTTNPGVGM
jgi:hypothetical protein